MKFGNTLAFLDKAWQYANAFLEAERRGVNQASFAKRCCSTNSVFERLINVQPRERPDVSRDEELTQIRVR